MTKYRKLPVVIEAELYNIQGNETELEEAQDRIADFIEENISIVGHDIIIETLEGDMTATIGDYIIKGVNGEFYPCKPDIFEKTYETVTDAVQVNESDFELTVRPVIKFMNTIHPHHTLIITADSAELLEGQKVFTTKEYLKD
jgi:uncharacterized protein YeeX (DUF496 family)